MAAAAAAAGPLEPIAYLRQFLLQGLSRAANVPFFPAERDDPLLAPRPGVVPGPGGVGGGDPQPDADVLIPVIPALPAATPREQVEQYFSKLTPTSFVPNLDVENKLKQFAFQVPNAIAGRVFRFNGPFVYVDMRTPNSAGESDRLAHVFGKVHSACFSLDALVNGALRLLPNNNNMLNGDLIAFVNTVLRVADPVSPLAALVALQGNDGGAASAVVDALPTGLLYLGTGTAATQEDILAQSSMFPYAHRSPWFNGVRYDTVYAMARKRCLFPRRDPAADVAACIFVGIFVDSFIRTALLISNLQQLRTRSGVCRDILERVLTEDANIYSGHPMRSSRAIVPAATGLPVCRFAARISKYCCEPDWWVGMNLALSTVVTSAAGGNAGNYANLLSTFVATGGNHAANIFADAYAHHHISRISRYGKGNYGIRILKRKCTED